MTPPPDLRRFGAATRLVHRTTALLMTVCLVTAAGLYVGPFAVAVGHRHLVEQIHVLAGVLLPAPLLLGLLDKAVRADVSSLDRFLPVDRQWLRAKDRRSGRLAVGKFNAGQKLNAALLSGGVLVLLGTGLIMRFPQPWPLHLRTGATFVHDWVAFGALLLVVGHLWYATRDPVARRGMRTGVVPTWWAAREHRAWVEAEAVAQADDQPAQPSSP